MVCKNRFLEFLEDQGIQLQMKLKQVKLSLTSFKIKRKMKCSEYLSGLIVNFIVDKWSIFHDKGRLCVAMITKKGENSLLV